MYGDAAQRTSSKRREFEQAKYLLVTVPEMLVRTVVIMAANDLNPNLRGFREGTSCINERAWLEEVGRSRNRHRGGGDGDWFGCPSAA